MKYYYYISKTKLEMFINQVKKYKLPGFNIKFSVPGVDLDIKDGNIKIENAISNLNKVIKKMYKENIIKNISNISTKTNSDFIIDNSNWHHGIFYFSTQYCGTIATYLLWKKMDNALFFLVGSPNNITGEKIVNDGVFISGTSGAYLQILDFINTTIKSDETSSIQLHGRKDSFGHPQDLPDDLNGEFIYNGKKYNSKLISNPFIQELKTDHPSGYIGDDKEYLFFDRIIDNPAFKINLFCKNQLSNLIDEKIETVFNVFNTYEIDQNEIIKGLDFHIEMAEKYDHNRKNLEELLLLKDEFKTFNKVIIGSPLYVAKN